MSYRNIRLSFASWSKSTYFKKKKNKKNNENGKNITPNHIETAYFGENVTKIVFFFFFLFLRAYIRIYIRAYARVIFCFSQKKKKK